jgi:hypothetical protein
MATGVAHVLLGSERSHGAKTKNFRWGVMTV